MVLEKRRQNRQCCHNRRRAGGIVQTLFNTQENGYSMTIFGHRRG